MKTSTIQDCLQTPAGGVVYCVQARITNLWDAKHGTNRRGNPYILQNGELQDATGTIKLKLDGVELPRSAQGSVVQFSATQGGKSGKDWMGLTVEVDDYANDGSMMLKVRSRAAIEYLEGGPAEGHQAPAPQNAPGRAAPPARPAYAPQAQNATQWAPQAPAPAQPATRQARPPQDPVKRAKVEAMKMANLMLIAMGATKLLKDEADSQLQIQLSNEDLRAICTTMTIQLTKVGCHLEMPYREIVDVTPKAPKQEPPQPEAGTEPAGEPEDDVPM